MIICIVIFVSNVMYNFHNHKKENITCAKVLIKLKVLFVKRQQHSMDFQNSKATTVCAKAHILD